MKSLYKITLFVFILIFSACVKDVDFEQVNDIEFEPAVAIPLLDFEFSLEEFQDLDILVNRTIREEEELPDLDSELIQEDLDVILFHFELSNQLEGDITMRFSFLDENGVVTYELPPLVVLANDENFIHEEEIVILNNPRILQSKRLVSSLNYNGTTLSSSSEDSFRVVLRGDFFVSTN